jgi:hypothetical protein
MKPRASSVMALRPIAGAPSLTRNDAIGEKKLATAAGSWPHQAAVYRRAKSVRCVGAGGHRVDSFISFPAG